MKEEHASKMTENIKLKFSKRTFSGNNSNIEKQTLNIVQRALYDIWCEKKMSRYSIKENFDNNQIVGYKKLCILHFDETGRQKIRTNMT